MRMIEISAGGLWANELACGRPGATAGRGIDAVHQTTARFKIDYATVDCEQWADCADRGDCDAELTRKEYCKHGHAVVHRTDAKAYCASRGARLPTSAQWNRAIRGDSNHSWPMGATWEPDHACLKTTVPDGFLKRCEYVSASGVLYAMENPNDAEWTRDTDCILEPDGSQRPFAVAIDTTTSELGIVMPNPPRAEFRCVVQ